MARARRVERRKHELQFAFRQTRPGMTITRLLGRRLDIGQIRFGNLEAHPDHTAMVPLGCAISTDALRRGGFGHV